MRTIGWAIALVLLATSVQASLLEEAISYPCEGTLPYPMDSEFCHYQYDAGSYGDARDTCGPTNKGMTVGPADSHQSQSTIYGLLVPVDDTHDFYEVNVPSFGDVEITVTPHDPLHADEMKLRLTDTCGSGLLATGELQPDNSVVLQAHNLTAGIYFVEVELETVVEETLEETEADDPVWQILLAAIGQGRIYWEEVDALADPDGTLTDLGLGENQEHAQSDGIGPITVLELETQCHPYCMPQNLGRFTEAGLVGYKQTAVFL
ncbi:MAG: hypothetical protein ACPGQL_04005 [Thermoplasmatota archaeon]